MTYLSYVLDTCRVNASTINAAMNAGRNPRSQSAFQFGWKLVTELIIPFIRARLLNGLNVALQQKTKSVLANAGHALNITNTIS